MSKISHLLKTRFLLVIFIICAIIPLTGLPSYQFYILERGMQKALVVLSLVILLGYTGQLSLGHAGLVAVGSYVYAILCVKLGLSPWIGFIAGPVVTGIVGVLLGVPSFKLSGPFLVVNTIAFGEIVRILILNNEKVTGGPYGISGVPSMFEGLGLYYFILIVVFLVCIGTLRLSKSRIGLAFKAIKEDEIAASVMGVNVNRFKLLSFIISSVLAGMSGVFFACLAGYLNPDSFTFSESATYLLMVVMGGMSNVTGAIVSSEIVTALPEIFRFMTRSRLVIYALILLLYLRFSHQIDFKKIMKFFKQQSSKNINANTGN